LGIVNSEKFPVIPRGGGTGLTGGALAVNGGLVIAFERFNRIIDIDTANRMAVVEPGVVNGILQEEAEKSKLFYPVNPASMDSCSLGGNVAEATGGANTVRYGTTRNYITGMKAVTGSGDIWNAGGKVVKNSTDQSLIQLMCGSEGTLSIFTELTFRLIQKPVKNTWIIAPFKDIYRIPALAGKIFSMDYNPTMVELMDSDTLTYCSSYLKMDIQFSRFHQLLVRFDSGSPDELKKISVKTGEMCLEYGAEDVLVADTKAEQEKIWKIRSSIHDAIVNEAKCVCEEDVVVPVGRVAELIKDVYLISEKHGFPVAIFGHMGDGNMHLNFTAGGGSRPGELSGRIERLREDVFKAALGLGGRLSGEHGIGISKKPFFGKFIDAGYIRLLKNIKKEFDPNNILNPGKIFDTSALR
ncbi:unnamed protein product, partial [marine sediment metagenome]